MTLIELIATVFGLLCVWLYVRQSIWSWPTGLVQVCLYAWIFFHARLYSDVLLHLIYIVLQIYGWLHWSRRGGGGADDNALPVTRLRLSGITISLAISAVGTILLGGVMSRYTNADLPYWDAAIAMLSLVAQFLLTRKLLDNWLFWIVVDVLAIGVYAYKGLYITTGLYAVFLFMATTGWFTWLGSYREQHRRALTNSAAGTVSSSANSCRPTAGISS